MTRELTQLLAAVDGPETFLIFASALADDRRASVAAHAETPSVGFGADAGGWESVTIEHFLDAAVRWAEDSSFGRDQGVPCDNPWRQFATFLYCGKLYE